MNLRTPLSQAQGLGSAKEGIHHWWMQRLTSIALIPLSVWFGFSLATLPDLSHAIVFTWLGQPINFIVMFLFVTVGCYHMALGIQVIIEDYVHTTWLKVSSIIGVQMGSILLAIIGSVALLKVFL